MEKLKHFDLFSGYGGFTLALERVYANNIKRQHISEESESEERTQGGERAVDECGEMLCSPDGTAPLCNTIGFSEIDKYASAVLKYHWPNIKNYGDITKIDARSLPYFDLLTGGFPCQSFSIAGKRGGFEDTRGTLAFDMLNIAKEKTPKYILAENVKGLVSHDGGRTLKTILASFQELGYTVSIEILNAKNYGVPQNRERIFILGMFIPTICKEIINTGFQAKTDTSAKIIKGFLFQSLLNNLNEVQKLQETASKDLVCGLMVLNAITNGLNEKLELSNEICKNHWQSFVGLSLQEMRELFTTKPDNSEEKQNTKDGISFTEENTSHSEETELWQNIEKLWRSLWEEIYPGQSKFTISTAISQIIEKKTFTYAEMLLTIVSFIIQLRNSSSRLWNDVLSDLIVLKGNIFYEPITNKTEEKLIGRSCFIRRSNLSSSQQPERIFVIGFRDGSPREVFFERGNDRQALKQIIGGSQGYRVYDIDGTSVNIASQAGGVGAKTGLYAVTRGRSTEPWKESEIAPSRRLSDKDDIKVVCQLVLTPNRLEKRQNGRRIKENGEPSFTLTGQDKHGVLLKNYINKEYAKDKINSIKILQILQAKIGEKAFYEWAIGRLGNFQEKEILQSKMYGEGVWDNANQSQSTMDDGTLSRKEVKAERELRNLWNRECERCSSQEPRLEGQFIEQLTKDMSELSQSNTPRIRRLTPIETERLMGLPDNWTKYGITEEQHNKAKLEAIKNGKSLFKATEISDSQRYKLCGNGVVVNVVEEIIKNIIL